MIPQYHSCLQLVAAASVLIIGYHLDARAAPPRGPGGTAADATADRHASTARRQSIGFAYITPGPIYDSKTGREIPPDRLLLPPMSSSAGSQGMSVPVTKEPSNGKLFILLHERISFDPIDAYVQISRALPVVTNGTKLWHVLPSSARAAKPEPGVALYGCYPADVLARKGSFAQISVTTDSLRVTGFVPKTALATFCRVESLAPEESHEDVEAELVGGVDGRGSFGGMPSSPPPPPPPPPPSSSPKIVPQSMLEPNRISGDRYIAPDVATRAAMKQAGQTQIIAVMKLCLADDGTVSSVMLLKSAGYKEYDQKLLAGVRQWKYRPFLVDGKPVPVCTSVTSIYRQSAEPPAPAKGATP